jgi:iron complex transport system ATP-binding protein
MMLRANNLLFEYGRAPILVDVSLDVPEGKLCGLVGPNGAGKSTLLRCLHGAIRPRSGTVSLDDCELSRLSRREVARAVGVVPQHCHPAFPVPVAHFVGMGRFAREPLFGGPSRADRAVVERCLDEMNLRALASRSVDELSGGEFRRVLIAQALAQEPRILLFDEPVQQLDLLHQLEVMEFARSFARRGGTAALVVLHDLGLAARYCDSLALLHRGRIVNIGAPDEVLTEDALRRVWGVRASIERSPATGAIQVVPLTAFDAHVSTRDGAHTELQP